MERNQESQFIASWVINLGEDSEKLKVANYDIENELSSIILTPAEIEIVLKSLPVGKAVGPDGISNKILRELSGELSLPFCSLFNQSLQTGVFPDCWKI